RALRARSQRSAARRRPDPRARGTVRSPPFLEGPAALAGQAQHVLHDGSTLRARWPSRRRDVLVARGAIRTRLQRAAQTPERSILPTALSAVAEVLLCVRLETRLSRRRRRPHVRTPPIDLRVPDRAQDARAREPRDGCCAGANSRRFVS